MALKLRWLGHNAWLLSDGKHELLIDPFLSGSPSAPVKASELSPHFILLSHGHGDHVGDTVEIAKRTGATVVSNYEICEWLAKHGVQNTSGGNLGGWQTHAFGRVQLTLAWHSSTLPDGSPAGNPSGFLIEMAGKRLYFACDTALFSDMQLIGADGLDLAVVPIGDFYTMGISDAVHAVRMLKPKRALPCHYDTFPPIAQDAAKWAQRVQTEVGCEAVVLQPGETITL
jgi:L-ascorbate metabolism protein UlaG (beta-lactamase superfamily)